LPIQQSAAEQPLTGLKAFNRQEEQALQAIMLSSGLYLPTTFLGRIFQLQWGLNSSRRRLLQQHGSGEGQFRESAHLKVVP
jgi:hypothetical protein